MERRKHKEKNTKKSKTKCVTTSTTTTTTTTTTSTTTTAMPHHVTRYCCVLVVLLLSLQHTLQANQNLQDIAENCREYCIMCNNDSAHKTHPAPLGAALEVSLQVTSQGGLPYAHITVPGSQPNTYVMINQENVTLWVGGKPMLLTLSTPRPAFSWVTLVLASPAPDTMLMYTPEDRVSVLTAKASLGPFAFVSSNRKTHVVFNCLSGCLIRNVSSALVGGAGVGGGPELQPPFTLYLNPAPRPPRKLFRLSTTPILTFTHNSGTNTTVNASAWTPDRWYRAKVLVGNENRVEMGEEPKGEEQVREVTVLVPEGRYRLTTLRGFSWTLHCPPQGITTPPAAQVPTTATTTTTTTATTATTTNTGPGDRNTKNEASTSTQTPEGETKGTGEGGKGNSGGKPKQGASRGGAGAGEVVAWVLAGLALFMVMILALALCTKTARPTHAQNLQDFPPSVGVLSFNDVAYREPEENSEPGTPTLTVPANHAPYNPHKHPVASCKAVEG